MAVRIQVRRGTAAQWTSANPVLAAGEPGFETDTGWQKVGNGSDAWVDLAYEVTRERVEAVESSGLALAEGTGLPTVSAPEEVPAVGQFWPGSHTTAFEVPLTIATAPAKVLGARARMAADLAGTASDYWRVDLVKYPGPARADALDITDDFDDLAAGQALPGIYTPGNDAAGNRLVGAGDGEGLKPETVSGLLRPTWRSDFTIIDGEVTIETLQTAGNAQDFAEIPFKVQTASGLKFLLARLALGPATQYVRLYKATTVYTERTQIVTKNLTSQFAAGLRRTWLRAGIVGNVVTLEVFTTDPALGDGSPYETLSHTLTSTDITDFGAGVKGHAGLAITSNSNVTIRLPSFRVAGVRYPAATVIASKKNTPADQTGIGARAGQPIVAHRSWPFDGYPFDPVLRYMVEGDELAMRFTPVGSAGTIVDPYCQAEVMAQ